MPNKGKLIVISAPSGSGKTTLINLLRKEYPHFVFSISATTRPPRGRETDGVEYFFLTEDEFKEKVKNREFVEHKTVYGNSYGTLKKFVDDLINDGTSVIFDVDVQGGLAIKEVYPDDSVMIFIYPPSLEILKNRLEQRGTDAEENIKERIKFAKIEMAKMNEYSYNVENDRLEEAYAQLKKVLRKEGIIK